MVERHQSFDHQRLWADLLWSPAMAFNLFGDLAADVGLADRAVHTWWPDTPGKVSAVHFAHSPGRLDRAYLGNLVDLDVAFELDVGKVTRGVIGVVTKYHDRVEPREPKPTRAARYRDVAERSGLFAPGAIASVNRRSPLLSVWLEHLLVLSMLQHPDAGWSWGRYVVVHAAGNTDFADACASYRALLVDPSTFSSMTVEQLLDSSALPASTVKAFRRRYVPG